MRFPIVLALACFALVAAVAAEEFAHLRVVDGDTVAIEGVLGAVKSVRLVGFNAPETGFRAKCDAERALGVKAKRRLAELAGGARLTLVACACRKGTARACNFGRACGVLAVGRRDVALTMIGEGLAVAYSCGVRGCPKLPRPWCQ